MAAPDNLRDEIAVKAVLVMLRAALKDGVGDVTAEEFAVASYRIADAMLKERAK